MLPPGSPAPPVGDSGPARREAAGTVRGPPPGSKFRNRESTEPSGRRQGRRLPWFGFRLRRGPEAGGSPSRRSRRRGCRCLLSPRSGAGRFPPGPRASGRDRSVMDEEADEEARAAPLSALVRPPIRVDDPRGPGGRRVRRRWPALGVSRADPAEGLLRARCRLVPGRRRRPSRSPTARKVGAPEAPAPIAPKRVAGIPARCTPRRVPRLSDGGGCRSDSRARPYREPPSRSGVRGRP